MQFVGVGVGKELVLKLSSLASAGLMLKFKHLDLGLLDSRMVNRFISNI
jgi:hypothetical protein